MYERMLDKSHMPAAEEIQNTVGTEGMRLLDTLENFLHGGYSLNRELRFPFGNDYGWGYKYVHKSAHLCYLFFERGAFTVTLQIGKKELPALQKAYGRLLPKTRELWNNRYPCGEGGCVHYRVLSEQELADVVRLICIKKKPLNQTPKDDE